MIIQQPDALSLSGNLKKFIVSSGSPVTFVLKDGATVLLDASYEPGADGRVTIDVKDIIESRLTFSLSHNNFYKQTALVKTFTAIVDGETVSFKSIRAGVANLADTSANWLKLNFLTWQPTEKTVTYYSPEWITYYAAEACTLKLKAYYNDGTDQVLDLGNMVAGNAYTANVQYAVVAGLLGNKYPSFYEICVENSAGTQLSYKQRYLYSEPKSEQEQWFLFENSLGGIDTLRAAGDTDFEGAHEHKISSIDGASSEYRVDTKRSYKKNTGYLDEYERRWLLDFFPSRQKFVHFSGAIRPVVVTESDVKYSASDLPSNYNFTYRFADESAALLNLMRNADAVPANITIPDIDSPDFSLPPRLSEYPRVTLSEGVILPAFDPFSETPKVTSFGAIRDEILSKVIHPIYQVEDIIGLPDALAEISGSSHSHPNKTIIDQLTQGNLDVLSKLSLDNGNLKIDANAYSTGGLSAYGLGSGGSSGGGDGGVDMLQSWETYTSDKANYYAPASLLVPLRTDALSRLTALESGSATSIVTTGTGNAITSIIKSGNVITANKGSKFAELGEDGLILTSQLPSYVDDVLEFATLANFPATGESGKIYVATGTNITYRWTGATYVEISKSIALGTTSSTAYRGDHGLIAYNHSQVTGNPHNTTFAQLGSKPTTLSGFGITDAVTSTVFNNHKNNINDEKHLTQAQLTNLINLSNWWKVDASGNLYTEKNLYSTKGVSALGLGSGGGGGGSDFDRLDAWADYDSTKSGWVLSALLGYDLNNRLSNVEGGSATSLSVTGTGDVIVSGGKSGNIITLTRGNQSWNNLSGKPATFTPTSHTHSTSDITSGIFNIARIPTGTSSTTVALGNHLHTGVYEPVFTKNNAFNKNFGTEAGTIAQGNDSRINNGQTSYGWGNHALAGYALNSALTAHTGNTTVHLTSTERTNWNLAYTNNHTHANKSVIDALTQGHINVLNKLSLDAQGNVKVDATLWATGGISALGLGAGGGSGGGVDMLDSWTNYTVAKTNYYVPANLLVPFRNDTLNRLNAIEGGSASAIATTGSGNAITSVSKVVNLLTFNKGLEFSLSTHTHNYLPLTGGTLTGAITAPKILINKAGNTASGISWYNSTYNAWQDYMANSTTTGNGVNANITAPSGTLVTSWARRSFIEGTAGYGWTFESGTNSSTTPSVVAEIRASDGAAKFGGSVTAPTFVGALSGNASSATKLQTARTIAGVSFDGSANIAIPFANLASKPTTLSGYGITDFTSHKNSNRINVADTEVNAIGYAEGVSLFNQVDGGLLNMAHSSIWQSQIFQDFRTGQIALRGKNSGTWTSWRTVWDSGNLTPVTLDTPQTITAQKTFNDGDAVYGLAAKPSIIVGDGGTTKAGAIKLMGNTSGAYGLLQATGADVELSHNSGGVYIQHYGAGRVILASGGGNVGIGNTSPSEKLDVTGTGRFAGALTAAVSVTTPKVIFAAAGWSLEQVGTELQMKHNGVIKQRMLSDGTILATGGVTALATT